ncbi:MAG TPA: hypothetical protein VFV74_01695 [Burkholderiales bacterium]|nr:hypothetical protein [Burkholderiales bacterium]
MDSKLISALASDDKAFIEFALTAHETRLRHARESAPAGRLTALDILRSLILRNTGFRFRRFGS